MAATSDDADRVMNQRLARAYGNKDNATWAADYFARDTHPNHSDPAERARHERHVAAVEQLQTDIQRDHDEAAYRAQLGFQTGATRQQLEVKIQAVQNSPAWQLRTHRDHADAIAQASYLYKQISALK